ncbi:MAG TPA: metal-dependent transcriptional regulator [Miltoncostaeaceae bacterium]|nr:metal-dependent transcriptional regulator [Miltoncostaeaceae bacterium]
MSTPVLTPSQEQYLLAVAELESACGCARVCRVGEKVEVSAASASVMLRRLAAAGLVEPSSGGVRLTDAGRSVVARLEARRRALAEHLRGSLGLPPAQVDEELRRLAHFISPSLEARLLSVTAVSRAPVSGGDDAQAGQPRGARGAT